MKIRKSISDFYVKSEIQVYIICSKIDLKSKPSEDLGPVACGEFFIVEIDECIVIGI